MRRLTKEADDDPWHLNAAVKERPCDGRGTTIDIVKKWFHIVDQDNCVRAETITVHYCNRIGVSVGHPATDENRRHRQAL